MDRKTISIVAIGLIVLVAAIVAGLSVPEPAKAGELQEAEPHREIHYSSHMSQDVLDDSRMVTVARGGTLQIPVDVYAELDKTTAVSFGVTSDGQESILAIMGKSILHEGIQVTTGKSSFAFPVEEQIGIDERGSTTITISVGTNAVPGAHPLSLVLYEMQSGYAKMSTEYFTLIVE